MKSNFKSETVTALNVDGCLCTDILLFDSYQYLEGNKGKVIPLQAPCGRNMGRGVAVLFHDCGTRRRWLVSSTPRPHFTRGKDPAHILQEAGWAPGPVWTVGKPRPHRDSIPHRPARSQVEENRYLFSPGYVHFAEYNDLKINPVKSNGNYMYHLLHFVHTLYLRDFPCGFQDK